MVLLTKKKEKDEEAILIAENAEDWKTIDYLYHSGVVFGAFKLYNYKDDKTRTVKEAKFLGTHYPLCDGMLHINIVKNYVPNGK